MTVIQQETREDFNIQLDSLVARKDALNFGAEELFSPAPFHLQLRAVSLESHFSTSGQKCRP